MLDGRVTRSSLARCQQPLGKIGRSPTRLCQETWINRRRCVIYHNLAPLKLRRNIAALGFVHRVTLGLAHPDIAKLFPPEPKTSHRFRTRLSIHRHGKQLMDRCDGSQNQLVHRSLFGMVRVYNLLPEHAIEMNTVHSFQKELTSIALNSCQNSRTWQSLFCARTSPLVVM